MPEWKHKMVKALRKKDHSEDSAWAITNASKKAQKAKAVKQANRAKKSGKKYFKNPIEPNPEKSLLEKVTPYMRATPWKRRKK